MKKYEKVRREDYEAWYRDNRDYRERVRADESRLAYHLMPETGWLNDPNGLCQFQGLYHIYYQYTPFEPTGRLSSGVTIPHGISFIINRRSRRFFRTRTWMPMAYIPVLLMWRIRPSTIFTQAM